MTKGACNSSVENKNPTKYDIRFDFMYTFNQSKNYVNKKIVQ